MFGQEEGWRGNYKSSSFVLLCSSASVVLNLHTDKRTKLHINMSRRRIDDVRFWDRAGKRLEPIFPSPSQSQLLADCHCFLFLVVASLKGRLAHLTNRHGSADEQITTFKSINGRHRPYTKQADKNRYATKYIVQVLPCAILSSFMPRS